MKILVATEEGQGERPYDFFKAEEGEPVIPAVMCDQLHEGCVCNHVMVGVRTGRETTTAIVVHSDMTRAEYRRQIAQAASTAFAGLDLPESLFERQADDLLQLAAELPAGVVIGRDGDEFNPRALEGIAAS